eukprot:SAG11_NODE_15996_length_560_cov_0.845987_2_plen_52_part_01
MGGGGPAGVGEQTHVEVEEVGGHGGVVLRLDHCGLDVEVLQDVEPYRRRRLE